MQVLSSQAAEYTHCTPRTHIVALLADIKTTVYGISLPWSQPRQSADLFTTKPLPAAKQTHASSTVISQNQLPSGQLLTQGKISSHLLPLLHRVIYLSWGRLQVQHQSTQWRGALHVLPGSGSGMKHNPHLDTFERCSQWMDHHIQYLRSILFITNQFFFYRSISIAYYLGLERWRIL